MAQEMGLRVCLGSQREAELLRELRAALLPSSVGGGGTGHSGAAQLEDPEFWLLACLRSRKFDVHIALALLHKCACTWRCVERAAARGALKSEKRAGRIQQPH